MSDPVLTQAQSIAELLGVPVEPGQGDPALAVLTAVRAYLESGGGGGGSAGLDGRKLEKKTVYADTSWDWWKAEADGGGHWSWDAVTGILRFNGFINNPQSPVVFESSSVLGGGPNFDTSGGARIGNRLIAAWNGGGRERGEIRTYHTVGRSTSVFTAADEITTQAWVQSFLASDQGLPRSPVTAHADLALIASPRRGDWVLVADDGPVHPDEAWYYVYNGLTWAALHRFAESDGTAGAGYRRHTVQGDGSTAAFKVPGLPGTARDFLFKLNSLSLDEADYTWVFGETGGDLTVHGFIPLSEDVIEIFYRS